MQSGALDKRVGKTKLFGSALEEIREKGVAAKYLLNVLPLDRLGKGTLEKACSKQIAVGDFLALSSGSTTASQSYCCCGLIDDGNSGMRNANTVQRGSMKWLCVRSFVRSETIITEIQLPAGCTPAIFVEIESMWQRKRKERKQVSQKNCLHFSICACHPCAGAMLIFSVSFQF